MDECMDGYIIDGWMDILKDGWIDIWIYGWMYLWIDWWTHGSKGECL